MDDFENTAMSLNIVWSEEQFDKWKLTWSTGVFYDVLEGLDTEGCHVSYGYDILGRRISKNINGKQTEYAYDEEGRLVREISGKNIIEYRYCFDKITGKMMLSGFRFQGIEYIYSIDESGLISGILQDNREVVRYFYEAGVCNQVMALSDGGEWIDKIAEKEFVGNVNPFRYKRYYFDEETGWYWIGRYYSQKAGRFIDGVSAGRAEELMLQYGKLPEIHYKIYTFGGDKNAIAAYMADVDQVDYVARVLYCESNVYIPDQQAVAWCIKNRMLQGYGGVTTAYGQVTMEGEFSAVKAADFWDPKSGNAWLTACQMTQKLVDGENPTTIKPSYYSDQISFRSVNSFNEKASQVGNKLYYEGHEIENVIVVNYGSITSYPLTQAVENYSGQKNIFFNFVE